MKIKKNLSEKEELKETLKNGILPSIKKINFGILRKGKMIKNKQISLIYKIM